jgi:hypothetical protein
VIVTAVSEATEPVVAVKAADDAPAGTVTVAGTWAAAVLLEVKLTTAPPVGAGLSRATVPVDDAPPSTVAGLTLTPLRAATAATIVIGRLVLLEPEAFVTVKVTVPVPVDAYVWTGFCAVEVVESPKPHNQEVGLPVDVSVNCTGCPITGEAGR